MNSSVIRMGRAHNLVVWVKHFVILRTLLYGDGRWWIVCLGSSKLLMCWPLGHFIVRACNIKLSDLMMLDYFALGVKICYYWEPAYIFLDYLDNYVILCCCCLNVILIHFTLLRSRLSFSCFELDRFSFSCYEFDTLRNECTTLSKCSRQYHRFQVCDPETAITLILCFKNE